MFADITPGHEASRASRKEVCGGGSSCRLGQVRPCLALRRVGIDKLRAGIDIYIMISIHPYPQMASILDSMFKWLRQACVAKPGRHFDKKPMHCH